MLRSILKSEDNIYSFYDGMETEETIGMVDTENAVGHHHCRKSILYDDVKDYIDELQEEENLSDDTAYIVTYFAAAEDGTDLCQMVDYNITKAQIIENVKNQKYREGADYFTMDQLQPTVKSPAEIKQSLIRKLIRYQEPENGMDMETPYTVLETFRENASSIDPEQIFHIWETAKEKEPVEALFHLFTEVDFKQFLEEALEESSITRKVKINGSTFEVNLPKRLEDSFPEKVKNMAIECDSKSGGEILDLLERNGNIHAWMPVEEEVTWDIRTEETDENTEM